MKKILFFTLMLLFTNPTVEAYQVNYNGAGGVKNITNGGISNNFYTQSTTSFGTNAQFLPANAARVSERNRQREYEKAYLESLKNSQNINVNINTNGRPYYPPYNNGYRYNYYPSYGTPYGSNGIIYNNGNGLNIRSIRMY